MPKVGGVGSFEVPEGKRLVLAIEEDAGMDSCTASVPGPKTVARPNGVGFRASLAPGGSRFELSRA